MNAKSLATPGKYMHTKSEQLCGTAAPLGATVSPEGTNFSIFSANATGISIVLFDQPDWSADSHSLAFTWRNAVLGEVRYVAVNSFWQILEFDLPPITGGKSSGWLRVVDTSLASPFDIADQGEYTPIRGSTYIVNPRSAIILRYDCRIEG